MFTLFIYLINLKQECVFWVNQNILANFVIFCCFRQQYVYIFSGLFNNLTFKENSFNDFSPSCRSKPKTFVHLWNTN